MNIFRQIVYQGYEGSECADIVVEIIRNQLYNLFRALTREYGLLITIMR
jgi:hypothetical protein